MTQLRIGTRGSALALVQARSVAEALGGAEIVEVVTAGDRGASGGDKSRWVSELERALIDEEVDIAVHSAKDVPGDLAEGLEIVGVPVRADARDVLCGAASIDSLAPGSRVGTSSLRREAQLRARRDDLEVVAMRGNVDTRLRKLADGEWDAIVLALAGLERLDRADETGGILPLEDFVPAPGQGALALEARRSDSDARDAAQALTDARAMTTLRAERALSAALGATCRTPIGAHAVTVDEGLTLTAFVGLPDGSAWLRDRRAGSVNDPEALGRDVAARLLSSGADELLRRAEALAS